MCMMGMMSTDHTVPLSQSFAICRYQPTQDHDCCEGCEGREPILPSPCESVNWFRSPADSTVIRCPCERCRHQHHQQHGGLQCLQSVWSSERLLDGDHCGNSSHCPVSRFRCLCCDAMVLDGLLHVFLAPTPPRCTCSAHSLVHNQDMHCGGVWCALMHNPPPFPSPFYGRA